MRSTTHESDETIIQPAGDSQEPEPPTTGGAHQQHHDHGLDDGDNGGVIDPVCGMTVDPAVAREKGLHREYRGQDYYFCGKGCYLEFGDDPERFLDPSYVPSM